jgi:2-polyprenyl-3-methyl-5-hydroxy-6-metoxy-1,4-benzoquinol methylase
MTTATGGIDETTRQNDLIARLFEAAIGALEVFTVYIGDQLGFYRALADSEPMTSEGLAAATGTQERYVREWLEQQAAAGILTVEGGEDAGAAERRYALPHVYQEIFLDGESLSYLGGLLRLVIGVTRPLDAVLTAFRSGGGVAYADYGPDTREGIATMNRPMFLNLLGSEWLPAVPEIHGRLQADPPARVADIGCGTGWSSIAIARAYPNIRVDGLDLDEASVEVARRNAAAADVADRVTFAVRDAADPALAGRYDLVTAFEAVHDVARPVDVLRAARALLAGGGSVLIADENVGETFTAPGSDVERLNYAFSVLHCLPATMAEGGPIETATGTVMRPATLHRYATEAGFANVEFLPIENDFWRFYRLSD